MSDINVGRVSEDRQKALKLWGFECRCSLCTAGEKEISASDARRRKIELLRSQTVEAFVAGKPHQALRLSRQVLDLIPTEELFPLYSEQYENMARAYWHMWDREKADKYARMSLDVLAEQGYIEGVLPEHMDMMWANFAKGN